jgi:hypothetical protein
MSEIKTDGYVYVMISTLNQMVNYIPLKHFEFEDIYNLTIAKSDYVDNSRWDENLSKILKRDNINFYFADKDKNLQLRQDDINDIGEILDVLEANFNNNKIFWNITGGQRPFILAIYQFIQENSRSNDYICYLEGNKSKMVILQDNELINNDSYNLEDLQISTALELMGFDIKVTETSERNFLDNYENEEKEKTFYTNFLKKYINIEDREKLLENLIKLNDNYPSEKSTNFDRKLKEYQKERSEATENLKNILEFNDDEYQFFLEEIKPKKKDGKEVKAFGFILEKLAGYKILELAYGKIADMTLGEKINHLRDKDRVDSRHIDEFDIALLTKNGKFMIFECKSGGMEGDVAKSTKYSTYAVSGAYGLPILITPLLGDEIKAIRKKSTLSKDYSDDYKYLHNELYKNIRQAINSAIRAGLEVWGLDEIEENLKKYIEL